MESMEKNLRREERVQFRSCNGNLTEDMVMEILIRLPFRSIVRFQCVSKLWQSLTFDARKKLPRRMHGLFHDDAFDLLFGFPTAGKKGGILFVNMLEEAGDDVDTSLSFLPPSFVSVLDVDVCNGLLLCCLMEGTLFDILSAPTHYFVFNPATRKYTILPPLPYCSDKNTMSWLAFDPHVSIHYSVLSIVKLDGQMSYRVSIFSSEDHVWVVSEDKIELDSLISKGSCYHVFFDGVLYLLTDTSTVLGFNLKGKLCRKLQLPLVGVPKLDPSSTYWGICFGVCGGCLRIAGIVNDEMLVWELKGVETNKWVLNHTTNVHAMEQKISSKFVLRSFHFDADAILITAESALFCYHLSTTNVTRVCALMEMSQNRWSSHNLFYPYTPYYSEDLVFD